MTTTALPTVQTTTFRAMGCPISLTAVGSAVEPFDADARAIMSLAPPAENPTTSVIGRSGYVEPCACAGPAARARAASCMQAHAALLIFRMDMNVSAAECPAGWLVLWKAMRKAIPGP